MGMTRTVAVALTMCLAAPCFGQAATDARAAEREALAPLKGFAGTWRGPATVATPKGMLTITQTERAGPMLDGNVFVIEGRGFLADGKPGFNALGIVSYDPATKAYTFRSYAEGHAGTFPITLTEGGFSWEIPAGPATLRYTATVKDDSWHEVGERVMPGRPAQQIFTMTLTRVGTTDWPAGGAMTPH